MNAKTEQLLALYALGVPVTMLSKQYGIKVTTIHKYAMLEKVRRPVGESRVMLARVARAERIRRHVEEYPSVSVFSTLEAAA